MNAQSFWQAFLDTGAPEMYLLYNRARRMEETNVPDCAGLGPADNRLQ